ncbi:MAG: hypothetical protein FJ399_16800, partial [Verrucomicrobia bacterium]|nr:hypothetical protein [Verrucomicrobiota bacterium]
MLISAVLGLGLAGFLSLSRNSLQLSQRTLFLYDATNLAEAGLEEALYCFFQVTSGVAPSTAWAGWTISGTDAMRTLPSFNRDQNGVGTVKVFARGYDTTSAVPLVISQATILPFDRSPPIVKVLRLGLQQSGVFINGVAGLRGLSLKGQPVIDSFNSNPSGNPNG